jgi:predicted class III extradiol MEMO1 family dioxygenase
MPKVSWESAEKVQDIGVGEIREEINSGYEFSFLDLREETDMSAMLKGLPDDRCTCPHWGYVVSGTLTFTFADHSEVFEAGDAYYVGPNHSPAFAAGTRVLMISPEDQIAEVEAAIQRNMEAMQSS